MSNHFVMLLNSVHIPIGISTLYENIACCCYMKLDPILKIVMPKGSLSGPVLAGSFRRTISWGRTLRLICASWPSTTMILPITWRPHVTAWWGVRWMSGGTIAVRLGPNPERLPDLERKPLLWMCCPLQLTLRPCRILVSSKRVIEVFLWLNMGQSFSKSHNAIHPSMGMIITKQTRIPDVISDKFKASYGDLMKKMSDRLEEEILIQNALKGFSSGSQSRPTGADGDGPPRTSASPEWLGEYPWNFRKRLNLTGISVADFEAGNSLLEEKLYVDRLVSFGMWSTLRPKKISIDVFLYRTWYVFIYFLFDYFSFPRE